MGKVLIELEGEQRELKFNTTAIMEAEEVLGVSSREPDFITDLSLRKMVTLLWAGLLHKQPRLRRAAVAKWFDNADEDFFESVIQSICLAWLTYNGKTYEEAVEEFDKIINGEPEDDTEGNEEPKTEVLSE